MSVITTKLLVTTKKSHIFSKVHSLAAKQFWSHQYFTIWFNKPWWKSLPYGSNNLDWRLSFLWGVLGNRQGGGESGMVRTVEMCCLTTEIMLNLTESKTTSPFPHFALQLLLPAALLSLLLSFLSLNRTFHLSWESVAVGSFPHWILPHISSLKSHSATHLKCIKSANQKHVKD